MTDPTIFERCVEAVYAVEGGPGEMLDFGRPTATAMTRAAIQTIIDNTGSLRTAEELTRILGEV